MPYRDGYMKVRVWVPPDRPDFPERPEFPGFPETGLPGEPGQPLPPEVGWPGLPDVPGIGGGPIFPERPTLPGGRPDQGLPRPPRPVYPVVEDHDLGGHPEVPDMAMTRRITITDGGDQFTGYVLDPEPPQVDDDYEPRPPTRGLPGTWVAVLYGADLAWAWVRTPGEPPERPELPERPARPGQGLPPPQREPK